MCQFVTRKDILIIVTLFLVTDGINLHMGSLVVLNINIHDLNHDYGYMQQMIKLAS